MLNSRKDSLKQFMASKGYHEHGLLPAEKVRVYMSGKQLREVDGSNKRKRIFTLTEADIDPELGIEAKSFDTTIDEMNSIQDEILFVPEEVI